MATTREATISGPAGYQEEGVGNTDVPYREATIKGKFPGDNTEGERSQGEVPGAGSLYAAVLNERPNVSNPRNMGPSREPSRSASTPIPVVGMGSRKVNRL